MRVVKATRRLRTLAEKRAIVEETLTPGTSVASVARRHEVNANLLFGWRRLYQQGLLEPDADVTSPRLLPVQVSPPSLALAAVVPQQVGMITVALASGHRIEVQLPVDVQALAPVIELLLRRC